ncbi:hypothetical protein SHab15497_00034 [Acinetobacter phage SH-Ab 15497]|nr:hypothetical protein SHab15497_00034 [Acinetobacter phage SH-Ab 15497]
MAKAQNEVATQESGLAVPDFLKEMMNDNRGSEDVGADDIVIPRLELVQSLSKCRKKTDPAYIAGAEEGMLYNSVTRELYGESVQVVPVTFKKEFLLWREQDLGGGFGGAYPTEGEAHDAKAAQEKPDEWEIVDTAQHFCLLIQEGQDPQEIVISMSKSKGKCSRKWNSMVRLNGGPRFSRVYEVVGIGDQNSAGQDYHTLDVKNVGFVNEAQFKRAEKVYELIQAGKMTADRSVEGESPAGQDADNSGEF